MDYEDKELFSLICESNEEAKQVLFDKYKYIIDAIVKKYNYTASKLGYENNDLYQEALVGFSDAINKFDEEKNVKFNTFASLCIERRLQNAIMKAGRNKNKIILESLSLDYTYNENQLPLKDLIKDKSTTDPLIDIEHKEEIKSLIDNVNKNLSTREKEVFLLMIEGLTYQDIAIKLNKNSKQIDNTMQRIKQKIKKIVDKK